MLTLIVNGPLTGPLVRYLGLDKARNSDLVDKVFAHQCVLMDQVLRDKVQELSMKTHHSVEVTSTQTKHGVSTKTETAKTETKLGGTNNATLDSTMFANVNWKRAYSFSPVTSNTVLQSRIKHHEIDPEWMRSSDNQCIQSYLCCCCCCYHHYDEDSALLPVLYRQWQEYGKRMSKEKSSLAKMMQRKDTNSSNVPVDIELQEASDNECHNKSFSDLMKSTAQRPTDLGLMKSSRGGSAASLFGSRASQVTGFDELGKMARSQINQAANVGLARQRFSTMVRHAYKEYFEEGILCVEVFDVLCSAEDNFDDTLEHFFYVFSKPDIVKSMMLGISKYGDSSNVGAIRESFGNYTQLDDFKVDHRLNQFTRSIASKSVVSSRYVYWAQTNRCISMFVQRRLRQQIELAYGVTSAFIQTWNDVIRSSMDDPSTVSYDETIRMMILVEAEREVAAAKQVCDGLQNVYQECIATYQTYQAARVLILSERSTAKHFLEHAKISKAQCDSILEQCNQSYIRLLSSRPKHNVLPSVHSLVVPNRTSVKINNVSADFVRSVQQLPEHKQDMICAIIEQSSRMIPLGRNQYLKCELLTKNTYNASLPFNGAGFCFVARGSLFATQVIGPIFHKASERERVYLEDLARLSFTVMRDPTMGKKIKKKYDKASKTNRQSISGGDGHGGGGHGGGGHGGGGHGGGGHGGGGIHGNHHLGASENFNSIFFALPHRDELPHDEMKHTHLQKLVKESLDSGADMNGDGHTGMVEMLTYLRVRTFSKQKKIRMLAAYRVGSLIPSLDVLMDQTKRNGNHGQGVKQVERSHLLACSTEAIIYVCGTDVVQKLCSLIPDFEDLLWKKAAMLGLKRFGDNRDAKSLPSNVLADMIASSFVVRGKALSLDADQHAIIYVHSATKAKGSPWARNWEYIVGPSNISLETRPNDRAVVFKVKDNKLGQLFRTNRRVSSSFQPEDRASPAGETKKNSF